MTKRCLRVPLFGLLLFCLTTAPALAVTRFAVFSDPHFYDASLGTSGAAFEAYLQQDRKLIRESEALVQAVVTALLAEHAAAPLDFVIVPGDLTKDGALTSHKAFAAYLEELEAAGIAVFVVPGNHDINNPHALAYEEDTVIPVDNVSPEQFAAIYAAFGYAEAFARDSESLSYAVEPVPGLVLLGLDSCRYDDNLATGHPETGGAFSPATLDWATAEIEAARAAGKQVYAFQHHGLTEHYTGQSQAYANYVIADWPNVSETLAEAGLKLAFSGHYHANDITRRQWNDGDTELYDVETGSLVTAPCPYRIVTLHGPNAALVETRHITEIDYDTGGIPFPDYAQSYLYEGLLGLATYTFVNDYGLPADQAQALAPLAAQAFAAHYAGDETLDSDTYTLIETYLGGSDPTAQQLKQMLLSLWTDLAPADNTALVMLDPALVLSPLGTYATGIFDEGAAEIVAFDPIHQRIFVSNANANTVDALDASDPANPRLDYTIDLSLYGGGVNSVAVSKGLVAVAVEAANKQDPGQVVFFRADTGHYLNQVTVGALPDMLTFTPNGRQVLVANEGEPSDDYSVDPVGSVSIIDLTRGVKRARVRTAGFERFNADKAKLIAAGVRIFGPGASVAQDLEPEYITVAPGAPYAWVSLQENNAVAGLNLLTGRISAILPLGFKDLSQPGNGIDASDRDGVVNIAPYEHVLGMYQPDAIAAYRHQGHIYLVMANEGDGRDYDAFSEEARVKDLYLDPTIFPDAQTLQQDALLGRLKVTITLGNADGYSGYEKLYAFGGRSFSIFQPTRTGLQRVFDSGDQLEKITAALLPADFNSTNDENDSFDNRSDDKGPEPEGLVLGEIGRRTYLFLGLERVGGIMVYDISDPQDPLFVQYINNREFSGDPANGTAGDLGPEGLAFIPAHKSPNGLDLLAVANEISGTTTIYQIDASQSGKPCWARHSRWKRTRCD